MGITYRVDLERRLVLAEGHGTLTDQDVFGYQREVWSRPELAGFAELVDMRQVHHVNLPSGERLEDLATLSASMDPPETRSKFAIVASGGIASVLGKMYRPIASWGPPGRVSSSSRSWPSPLRLRR